MADVPLADVLVAIVLVVAVVCPWWMLRDLRTLPPTPARSTASSGSPSISVVVPARDEEQTLPALLASLCGLSVAVHEVVVVDDGSRDRTADVAHAAGARVLAASTPPPGWTGKAWACHTGAGATTGELLLFLDADTSLAHHAMAGLLELRDQHGGLVSVQPFHRVRRPYEQLSAYFNVVALLASGAFTRRPLGTPMAFGPCLLTSHLQKRR